MTTKFSAEDVAAAKSFLAKRIAPESDIYFLQRCSKTGARRYLRIFIVSGSQIIGVTGAVARACGFHLDTDKQEIMIDGGGFSAAFEIVDGLSHVLFGKGYQLHETAL